MEWRTGCDLSRRDFHRGIVAMGLAMQAGAALPEAPEPEDFYHEPARRLPADFLRPGGGGGSFWSSHAT